MLLPYHFELILTYRKWFVPALTRTEAVQTLVAEVGGKNLDIESMCVYALVHVTVLMK